MENAIIRKTELDELDQVMEIYARARAFMAATNNPGQWGLTKPTREEVETDIFNEKSYVCEVDGQLAAVFFFDQGEDPTYAKIYDGEWLNAKPYGVVHRIAVSGIVKGAGAYCLNWAFEQCGNLKIDTHRDNYVMQHVLKKNRFAYCGIIYIADGTERMAYQKVD